MSTRALYLSLRLSHGAPPLCAQVAFRAPVRASALPLSARLARPRPCVRSALAGGFRVPGLVAPPCFLGAEYYCRLSMRRPLRDAPQPAVAARHPVAEALGSPDELLTAVFRKLEELGVDVAAAGYEADHVCYRCSTTDEYKVRITSTHIYMIHIHANIHGRARARALAPSHAHSLCARCSRSTQNTLSHTLSHTLSRKLSLSLPLSFHLSLSLSLSLSLPPSLTLSLAHSLALS